MLLAVAIAFGCWLLGRHTSGFGNILRQLTIGASLFVAVALPWQQINNSQSPADTSRWQSYSPELVKQLRSEGRPVFINLTADWCLTCIANERISLHADTVEAAFTAQNIVTLKGDWTNTDPQITALLSEYGRSGVPLYLWFPANRPGKADVLPQLLSKDMLIEMANSNK